MKITINEYDFKDAFRRADRNNNFSTTGLLWLYEYFEQYERDTGEEMELDVVGICCDYAESTIDEVIEDYRIEGADGLDDDEKRALVLEYLEENTQVIGSDNSLVVFEAF